MLFAEVCSAFFLFNRQNRKPRTAEFYEGQLKRLLPKIGHIDAMDVRPYHLLDWRQTWHLIWSVQRLYSWAAAEMKMLPSNPLAELKRPDLGKRKRVLSPREIALALRASKRDFRRFILAARECVARPQEVRELEWSHLRWQGGFRERDAALRSGAAYFELAEYKGRERRKDPDEPRIIPISPRLGRLLARLARNRSMCGLIFTTSKGKPWDRNSLRERMRRVRRRINVPLAVKGEKVVCYTLRHSGATNLAAAGMQTSVLQLLLGHADIKTTQRYLHVRKQHLLDAWKRHCDGQNPPTN